jgi:hypothetical protein
MRVCEPRADRVPPLILRAITRGHIDRSAKLLSESNPGWSTNSNSSSAWRSKRLHQLYWQSHRRPQPTHHTGCAVPDPTLPQYLTAQIQLRHVPLLALPAPALDHLMLCDLHWRHHWQINHFASTRNTFPAQFVVAVWAAIQCVLSYLRWCRFLPRRILFGGPLLARFVWLLAFLFMLIGFHDQPWLCLFIVLLAEFRAQFRYDLCKADYFCLQFLILFLQCAKNIGS